MRELVVLGTASQVPTRYRNHNGYLLRWDDEGLLFDPGEGTQRQMVLAGVAASAVNRLCLTHFHGDHCLGVPGIIQRASLDRVGHPITAHFPASGAEYFARLRHASIFCDTVDVREQPIEAGGTVAVGAFGVLEARALEHSTDVFGYRLVEPDGRRFIPELLSRFGISGPEVGELDRTGAIRVGDRVIEVEQVSEARAGQRFAFVMDTRLCDGVYELADGADLLVIEATFLTEDEHLAVQYGHLTARQAAQVAAECRVRTLVLTHFSQRYQDAASRYVDEAAAVFGGDIVVAEDLMRVPVPVRR
ncbi:Ribonuclease Z [uncultured Mycobacterium sp.]|uniref:Ribonuclease Z n=1 Tax=uncultured Mycobacterium sp. TaxID=171292 RepID=A0A1Y5PDG6_9MYCO|nr:Ribonuclease Z [uncultured Mycobacterium sp.]